MYITALATFRPQGGAALLYVNIRVRFVFTYGTPSHEQLDKNRVALSCSSSDVVTLASKDALIDLVFAAWYLVSWLT